MHLQKAVEPYDVFARSLTIGPESMVMRFRPDEPMHNRYAVDHDFLSVDVGRETVTIAEWFAVADDPDRSYEDKLAAYQGLSDDYFQRDRYRDFCATTLPHIDEMVLDWVASPAFEELLTETVVSTYPAYEVETFLAHFRGLLGLWVADQAR